MKSLLIKEKEIVKELPAIVIPLVGKTVDELLEEVVSLKDASFDIVEWRIDYYNNVFDLDDLINTLKKLRNEINKPILITFRTKAEGGVKDISDEDYLNIYQKLLDTKLFELLDVEGYRDEEIVSKIIDYAHDKDIKVVVSYHNFDKTPGKEEILNIFKYLEKTGGDILKIALMPKSNDDVIKLIDASKEYDCLSNKPIVSMSMSEIGKLSRIIGEYDGSIFTFGSLKNASAPGQIAANRLKELLKKVHEDLKDTNIFLIGFMGTGKSTIAKTLHNVLNKEVLEMDEEIVRRNDLTIPEIFKKYGEEYFRNEETKLIEEFNNKKGFVVSCGGGVPLRENNVEAMRKAGKVILLTAKPETIYQRVKDDHNRPLLENNKNVEYINKLMSARKDKYQKAADIIINVDDKPVVTIIEEIIEKL